jgi:hypothetical protein
MQGLAPKQEIYRKQFLAEENLLFFVGTSLFVVLDSEEGHWKDR